MARAYPIELRERVLRAYDGGCGSIREVAELFGVSGVWIKKLLRQRRETGSIAPIEYRSGPKPKLSEAQRERLCELAAREPDLTLEELRRKLRLRCSVVTVWRALRDLGFTKKEVLSS